MSFPTKQAFVHYGSWDDETRSHPAMKWMEDYTKTVVDARGWEKGADPNEHHASDFTLQRSDGRQSKGAEEAWKTLQEIYGPFAGHKHDPSFLNVWETSDGWEMIGIANLFLKLPGSPANAVTDPQGEKWDGVAPSSFFFQYAKEGSGIKLKETKIFSDPSPVLATMVHAGALNGDQIVGMLKGA